TTATTEPATTTTTAPTEEEAILAAYQGYWDTWLKANDPPDPDHPDLVNYATGAALENARLAIANHQRLGQVIRLPADSQISSLAEVDSLEVSVATVSDCATDDSKLLDAATGIVLDGEEATFRFEASMHLEDGEWRVATVESIEKWEGIVECAE
ncbi:MAG TPA: hypothetical protein VIY72_06915, partial [Acidimicrobiales bacterium]